MTQKRPNILVLDIGGTHIKIRDQRHKEPVKIASGPAMTARRMVTAVRKAIT